MATNLGLGDLLQMRIWSVQGEQAGVNTIYYRVGTVTGTVADSDAAIDFDTTINAAYKALLSTLAVYRGIVARVIKTPLPISVFTIANAGAGTGGTTALPRQTSGLISWKTNFAGRGFRGRTYLPFPWGTAVANQEAPTAAYVTAINTLATAINGFTTATSGGGGPAQLAQVLRVKAPASPIPINDFLESDKWATQKRRGSFGRANVSPI